MGNRFSDFDAVINLSLVHPCDKANKGGCSQICYKMNETYECSCEPGFILRKDKATCQKGWLLSLTDENFVLYFIGDGIWAGVCVCVWGGGGGGVGGF